MNKKTISKVKKNIKHYTPEITATAIVIAGVAAIAYIARHVDEANEYDGLVLGLPHVALDKLKKDGGALFYETSEGNFLLTLTDI